MPEATLLFHLPEETAEFHAAVQAPNTRHAMEEIVERLFRPARKHGYPPGGIFGALEKCREDTGLDLIAAIEAEFWDILRDNDIAL